MLVLRALPLGPRTYWLDRERASHTTLERALELAVALNRLEDAQRLVSWGADLRISQDVMLSLASMRGHLTVARWLLDAGANPAASKSAALKFALMRNNEAMHALLSSYLPAETPSKECTAPGLAA